MSWKCDCVTIRKFTPIFSDFILLTKLQHFVFLGSTNPQIKTSPSCPDCQNDHQINAPSSLSDLQICSTNVGGSSKASHQ
jgi:hypothetical protein